jgi:ribosomal protein S26
MFNKFICDHCKRLFDEDESVRRVLDYHPYGEGFAAEYGCTCPECGSAEIALAVQCESCGNYIPEDEAEQHPITEDTICHDCFENSIAMAEALMNERKERIWG